MGPCNLVSGGGSPGGSCIFPRGYTFVARYVLTAGFILNFIYLRKISPSNYYSLYVYIAFCSQLCSGVDENAAGACAQLVFAPIDESFGDEAPLLPSGFRVIPLDPKAVL